MIIWIYGQHNAGKTTLATRLISALREDGHTVIGVDGDAYRAFTGNNDYTRAGRERNISEAYDFVKSLDDESSIVIASFITPYVSMRDTILRKGGCHFIMLRTTRETRTPVKVCRDAEWGEHATGVSLHGSDEHQMFTTNHSSLDTYYTVRAWVNLLIARHKLNGASNSRSITSLNGEEVDA